MNTSPTPDADRQPVTSAPQRRTVLLDQPFTEHDLRALRRAVAAHADATPLPASRVSDLVLIVSELAANAIRHGGGKGRLRVWTTPDALYCQVSDDGPGLPAPDPLPRQRPEPSVPGGRGLWLVLNYADSVTIDAGTDSGTAITAVLHFRHIEKGW